MKKAEAILRTVNPKLVKRTVNGKDNDEWTPLHVHSLFPICLWRTTLRGRVCVANNAFSWRSMQYAAWYNNLEVVETLLALGSEIDCLNTNKSTPLVRLCPRPCSIFAPPQLLFDSILLLVKGTSAW